MDFDFEIIIIRYIVNKDSESLLQVLLVLGLLSMSLVVRCNKINGCALKLNQNKECKCKNKILDWKKCKKLIDGVS